ncbi:hypothetical protein MMPV_000525 [Pyropia vietnamensis]
MRNHKLFFLFLLYTTLACAYALGLTGRFLVHLAASGPSAALHPPPPPRGLSVAAAAGVTLSARSTVAMAILAPLAVVVAAVAGGGAALLLGWNVACISRNRTTVEAHRCDDTTSHFVAPSYNRGVAANWRHVMGPTWWLTSDSVGDAAALAAGGCDVGDGGVCGSSLGGFGDGSGSGGGGDAPSAVSVAALAALVTLHRTGGGTW